MTLYLKHLQTVYPNGYPNSFTNSKNFQYYSKNKQQGTANAIIADAMYGIPTGT